MKKILLAAVLLASPLAQAMDLKGGSLACMSKSMWEFQIARVVAGMDGLVDGCMVTKDRAYKVQVVDQWLFRGTAKVRVLENGVVLWVAIESLK